MVAVLFAREDSIYKEMPGLDVYDQKRDARTFNLDKSVVAHPPCRAWGKLRYFSKHPEGEKDLAIFAVEAVRKCGGVLEHPSSSELWKEAGLPGPGKVDRYGGFTLPVKQKDFGHKAEKNTWLYICGVRPDEVPPIPLVLGEATHVIENNSKAKYKRPTVTKKEREATPEVMAIWLVDLAKKCSKGN